MKVGSRVEITLRASDANTAPFDDLAIHIDLEQLPVGAQLTEDMYAGSTTLVRPQVNIHQSIERRARKRRRICPIGETEPDRGTTMYLPHMRQDP